MLLSEADATTAIPMGTDVMACAHGSDDIVYRGRIADVEQLVLPGYQGFNSPSTGNVTVLRSLLYRFAELRIPPDLEDLRPGDRLVLNWQNGNDWWHAMALAVPSSRQLHVRYMDTTLEDVNRQQVAVRTFREEVREREVGFRAGIAAGNAHLPKFLRVRPEPAWSRARRRRGKTTKLYEVRPGTTPAGARVWGNWGGCGTWYSGVVVTARPSGQVDIQYDMGENETNVPMSRVSTYLANFVAAAGGLNDQDRAPTDLFAQTIPSGGFLPNDIAWVLTMTAEESRPARVLGVVDGAWMYSVRPMARDGPVVLMPEDALSPFAAPDLEENVDEELNLARLLPRVWTPESSIHRRLRVTLDELSARGATALSVHPSADLRHLQPILSAAGSAPSALALLAREGALLGSPMQRILSPAGLCVEEFQAAAERIETVALEDPSFRLPRDDSWQPKGAAVSGLRPPYTGDVHNGERDWGRIRSGGDRPDAAWTAPLADDSWTTAHSFEPGTLWDASRPVAWATANQASEHRFLEATRTRTIAILDEGREARGWGGKGGGGAGAGGVIRHWWVAK